MREKKKKEWAKGGRQRRVRMFGSKSTLLLIWTMTIIRGMGGGFGKGRGGGGGVIKLLNIQAN